MSTSMPPPSMAPAPTAALAAPMPSISLRPRGGVYVPPHKLRALAAASAASSTSATDSSSPSSPAFQQQRWEELRRSLHGLVNRLSASNLTELLPLFFAHNLIRARGLLVKSLMKAQLLSTHYTAVYAALVAILNTKLPEIGALLVTRLLVIFRRAYTRNDKHTMSSTLLFLAHLFSQRVLHVLTVLQLLTLLLEAATDDSVEVACEVVAVCGPALTEESREGVEGVMERLRQLLHEGAVSPRVGLSIERLMDARRGGWEGRQRVAAELDLVEEEDAIVHEVSLDEEELDMDNALNAWRFDEQWQQNEDEYAAIRAEILGDEASDEPQPQPSGDDEPPASPPPLQAADEAQPPPTVDPSSTAPYELTDMTETDLINLRRTIYLTIMSSLSYEETAHKLLKMQPTPQQQPEIINMIIECCLAEDMQVLTDRGFMSRADVFAACPTLAPSLAPAAATESAPAHTFGGAVQPTKATSLYWAPTAAEEAADKLDCIQYEKLTSGRAHSSVQLRAANGQYGRHCGVCGHRSWGNTASSAATALSAHIRNEHSAEHAAARAATANPSKKSSSRKSVSASSTASSTAPTPAHTGDLDAVMVDSATSATALSSAASYTDGRPHSQLLFASLDPSTDHLVYLPATALTYNTVTSLVEFTHAAEAPHWSTDADEYGLTADQRARMQAQSDRYRNGERLAEADKYHAERHSNGVSVLVDPHHEMYVRVGLSLWNKAEGTNTAYSADYEKIEAGALLSDDVRQRVKMTGQAVAGLAPLSHVEELPFAAVLGLTTEVEVDAFLQLYGYWLGDGCLDIAGRYVLCAPQKDYDKVWVLERLTELGLTRASGGVTYDDDSANGQLMIRIKEPRWVDYFFTEYGVKYAVAAAARSQPATHTWLIQPLPTSVKWFWMWVWRLRKKLARLVLAGLRLADGSEAQDQNEIFTSGSHFRDEICRLAIHAGFSSHFDIMYRKEDHRGYDDRGTARIAQHDSWRVSYSDNHLAAQPVLKNYSDIKRVAAPSGVPVWCVTVPPHGLIITRRVSKNARSVVTQASKPVVIGNCSMEKMYLQFYGSLAERFCRIDNRRTPGKPQPGAERKRPTHPRYKELMEECFVRHYAMIHRFETNRIRNLARLFAHLFATDAVDWQALAVLRLTEEDTTSAGRIFVKILLQETVKVLGLEEVRRRFAVCWRSAREEEREVVSGLMPRATAKELRFSINFFTSIGLGGLTEDMRAELSVVQERAVAQQQLEREQLALAMKREASEGDSSSESSSDSDSDSDSDSNSSSGSSDSYSSDSYSSESDSEEEERRRRRQQKRKAGDRERVKDEVRSPDRSRREVRRDKSAERHSSRRSARSDSRDGGRRVERDSPNGADGDLPHARSGDGRAGGRRADAKEAESNSRREERVESQLQDEPPHERDERKEAAAVVKNEPTSSRARDRDGGRDDHSRRRRRSDSRSAERDSRRGERADGRQQRKVDEFGRDIVARGDRSPLRSRSPSDERRPPRNDRSGRNDRRRDDRRRSRSRSDSRDRDDKRRRR